MKLPFKLGEVVEFEVGREVTGVIIGYTIRAKENIMYEVSWFHDGESRSAWFDPAELKDPQGRARGF